MSFDENTLAGARFDAGTVLAGRYQLLKAVGSGGMAYVYLAKDLEKDDHEVAVKTLHQEFVGQQQYVERFVREAQLLNKIDHPNIVKLYDTGFDKGVTFFTMEYVPGQSLAELMELNVFSKEQLADLVIQICKGLAAIHNHGITHRDLKPGNILVTEDGQYKISDFGMAREKFSRLTAENQIVGSVCYIAPEIWRGNEVTPFVDFYSLGIMLYELGTGEVPFDSAWPVELMKCHIFQEPPAPIEKNPDLPMWFNELVLKLLQKEPKDRPASNEEIIEFVTTARLQAKAGIEAEKVEPKVVSGSRKTESSTKVSKRVPDKTYIFRLTASKEDEDTKKGSKKRRKTSVVLPLPGNKAAILEIEKPSRDFGFLCAFLLSLQAFDIVFSGIGASRYQNTLEANPFLQESVQFYGAEMTAVLLKLSCILGVVILSFFVRQIRGVRSVISYVSCLLLFAAILPWMFLLVFEYYR